MSTKPWPSLGVHFGLTHEQYFAPKHYRGDRIFSKSLGGQFAPDPFIWKTLDDQGKAEPESDSISWGSLIDLLAFRPDDFAASYAVAPATYTSIPEKVISTDAFLEWEGNAGNPSIVWNGRKKECSEWKKAREAEGFTVMTPKELEEAKQPKPWNWQSSICQAWAEQMRRERPGCQIVKDEDIAEARKAAETLQSHAGYQALAEGAYYQVAMLGLYDGVPVRAALDILPLYSGLYGDCLADLKTCSRMRSRRELEKHVHEYGYHVQAWLYLSLWNALNPDNQRSRFLFVFQSSSPPYEVVILELKAEAIEVGGQVFQEWIQKWKDCNRTGVWPSKWEGEWFITLPEFAFRQADAALADSFP